MSNSQDNLTSDMTMAETVRQARQALGLSIRQAAAVIGVHQSFLSRLETGVYLTAKPTTLERIGRVLEIDERDLFALAGYKVPEGLPTFTPYLRAKYDLSDEALRELQDHFTYIAKRYQVKQKRPPAA